MDQSTMDFSIALTAVKMGKRISRQNWNGKGMWVALQNPDGLSKMDRPYLYIKIVRGEFVPWCPSHGDLLANDWVVVD